MTLRHIIAALLFLAAINFGSVAHAIGRDTVVDPRGAEAAENAPAAGNSDAMSKLYSDGGSSLGMVVTIFGYVVILGGLGVVVWYLFKRGVIRQPFSKAGEGNKLKIAETRMLGNRQFIMVVEYEDQKILLGVGPGKIDYLTNLHSYQRSEFPQIDPRNAGGDE